MPPKLSLEKIIAIKRMHTAGCKLAVIAEELEISATAVFCYSKGWKSSGIYQAKMMKKRKAEGRYKPKNEIINPIRRQIYAEVLEFINGLKKIGLNQNQIAERAGISRQSISQYILGKALPSEERYDKLKGLYEELNQLSEKASTL